LYPSFTDTHFDLANVADIAAARKLASYNNYNTTTTLFAFARFATGFRLAFFKHFGLHQQGSSSHAASAAREACFPPLLNFQKKKKTEKNTATFIMQIAVTYASSNHRVVKFRCVLFLFPHRAVCVVSAVKN
jgi:hypothetical protein